MSLRANPLSKAGAHREESGCPLPIRTDTESHTQTPDTAGQEPVITTSPVGLGGRMNGAESERSGHLRGHTSGQAVPSTLALSKMESRVL